MRKGWLIIATLALVALLGISGCDDQTPGESGFNLIFKYGIGAKNELDTFQGIYTKDMVMDPSITIPLPLSREEKDRIYQKMVEIDFFNYPGKFSITVPAGERSAIVTPFSSYYFKVQFDSRIIE